MQNVLQQQAGQGDKESARGAPGEGSPDDDASVCKGAGDRAGRSGVFLSVVTTCLNEQENVDRFVSRTLAALDRLDVPAELVIVDDGSTDQTWSRIQAWAKRTTRVRGLRHVENFGIESGWRTGLTGARGQVLCLIDADLQNQPEDIVRLFDAWRGSAASIAQGVRRPLNPPWTRLAMSKGLNVLLNTVFSMRLRDNKSGFVLCRREVLADVLAHRFRYRYFQTFIAVAAHARGYSIVEVETTFQARTGGSSFINNLPLRFIGGVLIEIVKAAVEYRGRIGRGTASQARVAVVEKAGLKGSAPSC